MKRLVPLLLILLLPSAASAGPDALLVEAGTLDGLAQVGFTLSATGAILDPRADPAIAAGAFMAGETLVLEPGAYPVALRSTVFVRQAALAMSGSQLIAAPGGDFTTLALAPGDSGRALYPADSPEATLAAGGRFAVLSSSPQRFFGVPFSDVDHDGTADSEDAFPLDPAASVDTDGDGYPNAWNRGRDASDSTTGLILDAFPDDPARFLPEDEVVPTVPTAALIMVALMLTAASRAARACHGRDMELLVERSTPIRRDS